MVWSTYGILFISFIFIFYLYVITNIYDLIKSMYLDCPTAQSSINKMHLPFVFKTVLILTNSFGDHLSIDIWIISSRSLSESMVSIFYYLYLCSDRTGVCCILMGFLPPKVAFIPHVRYQVTGIPSVMAQWDIVLQYTGCISITFDHRFYFLYQ